MAFLGFGSSAASKAEPYLNQIPGVAHQYLDPYIQQGQQAGAQLPSHYDRLMNDPAGYLNEMLSGYKASEGYNNKSKNLLNTARNAAASGGFSGTEFDQNNQASLVNSLMSEDMQQYLENLMGIHGQGLAGNQGLAQRGYEASGDLGSALGQNLQTQGGLAFEDQNNSLNRGSALLNAIITAAGTAAGGPAGGAGAAALIKLFGGDKQQSTTGSGGGGYNMGSQGGFNLGRGRY